MSAQVASIERDDQSLASDTDTEELRIPYITNRAVERRGAGSVEYGGERASPAVGFCEARFTPIVGAETLAEYVPFYLQTESRKIRLLEEPGLDSFMSKLAQQVQRVSTRSIVVFVHGYSYSMERTCRMAAEMQRLLRGKNLVIIASWPSNGLPSDYVSDLNDADWSAPFLAETIGSLAGVAGVSGVKVVAHSMGSRVALRALQLHSGSMDQEHLVEQMVLLAPDFDTETFIDLIPIVSRAANHITLYASENDTPLMFSEQLNGNPRLGQAGDNLVVMEGIETIDVTSTGRYQISGHEYFFFNPKVAEDLVNLLGRGLAAGNRPGLVEARHNNEVYWLVK